MLTIIAAIFVFSLLVVFHEGGHFLAAKSSGIKVNEFSVGMGPKIFSKRKGDTQYSIRALPIGGYVAMEGENDASEDPRSFQNASVWNRIKVVFAGPFTNFLLAFIIFTAINAIAGMMTTTIAEVTVGYPAEQAGLLPGDQIISINQQEVKQWMDIPTMIGEIPEGNEVSVEVKRNQITKTFSLITKDMDGRSVIGILPKASHNFFGAMKAAVLFMAKMIQLMFLFLRNLFRGAVSRNDVAGPIGVIAEVGKAASSGWLDLMMLVGFLNVNLGFFNLLPIPALDGSRLMFLLLEVLRGKPISQEKESMVHFVGFVFLMGLMAFVLFLDLGKLGVF